MPERRLLSRCALRCEIDIWLRVMRRAASGKRDVARCCFTILFAPLQEGANEGGGERRVVSGSVAEKRERALS